MPIPSERALLVYWLIIIAIAAPSAARAVHGERTSVSRAVHVLLLMMEGICPMSFRLDGDPRMTSPVSARRRWRWPALAVLTACAVVLTLAGCSSAPRPKPVPPPTGTLRLGYTGDLADAPALAGLQMGFISNNLGYVTLEPVVFSSPMAEAQALVRGQLDAAYLDPVTAVAVWQAEAAHGGLIKIVAGAASGGAELVARSGITSAGQLAHARVAAPPGGAQQTALEWWLKQNGVAGTAPPNASMTSAYLAQALRSGKLDAAWEPAPVDAELVADGAHVLVDEASLWPGGRFPTAVLVVTSTFLVHHAAVVSRLLRGQIQAEQYLDSDPGPADRAVGVRLAALQPPAVPFTVLSQAFTQIGITEDPMPASLLAEAQHAAAEGLLGPVPDLGGLIDLGPLNTQLRASGFRPVSS
jgi:NitT/TauT family transport system substrate-binding protein